MTIHCGFCNNTFHAAPREAICPKCKRPANRPLSFTNKILCAVLFPWGLIKALLLRASEPIAAMQAAICCVAGGGAWAALYFAIVQARG